jgi:hypothetical protein
MIPCTLDDVKKGGYSQEFFNEKLTIHLTQEDQTAACRSKMMIPLMNGLSLIYYKMMATLDREILLQTLRCYASVNRITQSERRSRWKEQMTQESLEVFTKLFEAWACTGKLAGGNQEALAQQRLNAHL